MFINKYITNISGLQLYQLLRFGTMLLISIVFAKSTLSTESIGNFELFLFITALFSSFWINGLIQAFLPLYKNNRSFQNTGNRSPELFNAYVLISILSILVIVILVSFKDVIAGIFTRSDTIPYFNLLLLYIFFSCPTYLIEYIYLLQNKPRLILTYGITTFVVQLLLVAVPAILGFGMETAVGGLVAVFIIRYIWLIILLRKHASFSISLKFLKEHIHCAWPLVVSALLGSSANYVDGFLVMNYYDSSSFAVFRYGAREFPLVVLMANAMSNAMIADFADKKKFNENLHALKNRSKDLMHLLFPVTIIFLMFSSWLYPRVFNPDFSESAVIFNIYLLLIISRLVFPHTILIGLKRTNIVMYASIAELFLNIILSLLFIGRWGMAGVAFATVLAFTLQKAIWMIYNKTVLDISIGKYVPLRLLGIYSFITIMVFILMN